MTIGASFGISTTPRSSVTGPFVSAAIATAETIATAATVEIPHKNAFFIENSSLH